METVSLTYREVAERFAISDKSARSLVARKRWRRTVGNDGKARIDIPAEALPQAPQEGRQGGPDAVPHGTPHQDLVEALVGARLMVARLEAELGGQRELVSAERRRADELAERVTKVEAERDQWITRATRPWWRRLAG